MWWYSDLKSLVSRHDASYPRYEELFAVLDDIGVKEEQDLDSKILADKVAGSLGYQKGKRPPTIGRSIVSDVIMDSILYASKISLAESVPAEPEIRLVASTSKPDCLNTLALFSNNGIVLSECEVSSVRREMAYQPRLYYDTSIVKDLVRCRPFLERQQLIVIPKKLWKVDREVSGPPELFFDYSSTQTSPVTQFLGHAASNFDGAYRTDSILTDDSKFAGSAGAPSDVARRVARKHEQLRLDLSPMKQARSRSRNASEVDDRTAESSNLIVTPLLKVGLPILKNCSPETMASIISDEVDAVTRMRYICKVFSGITENEKFETQNLSELFEKIEYEVSRLDLEYQKLIRKRQESLGSIFLGIVVLWFCAAVPGDFQALAKALAGTASCASGLKYVYAVNETDDKMRESDFYVAWKAWKQVSSITPASK